MSELVLGINYYGHDSSAALADDGKIIFAAAEERFSRNKNDIGFPIRAITAALKHAGAELSDLEGIAVGWNRPGVAPLHELRSILAGKIERTPHWLYHALQVAAKEFDTLNGLRPLRRAFSHMWIDPARFHYIDHHAAHAWSAYALSGFDDATVIVMDGSGAWQSTTIYHGRGGVLRPLRVYPFPNSLGVLYAVFTHFLGFTPNSDEWKVMGLAAYGKPSQDLRDFIRVAARGGYRVDARRLLGKSDKDNSFLEQHFGPMRSNPDAYIAEEDKDLAASLQQALERAVLGLVREGVRLTGSRNLCLAGGVAMNSKANGRVLASGLIDDIFIQPAATDDGTAVGAVLGAYAARRREVPRYSLADVYLGPRFTDSEIEHALKAYKLPVQRLPNIARTTAELLSQGYIVGWFQGRMEFGPRALGNRSILADPRDPAMKDRVNESIKYREGWRPFAPSCLAERMGDYFQPDYPSPYMILTFDVHPEKRSVIPAVTHVDNTARVQTVERDVNPRYWELISEFEKVTGVPVIMNTSFNLRGEPIVCTPQDAIRTFFSSGLDFLALGDYMLAKEHVQHLLAERQPAVVEVQGGNGRVPHEALTVN